MISENFIYVAAVISVIGQSSYLWATLKGRTKPNRVTWFLWGVAPMLAVIGALDEGVGLQTLTSFMAGFGPLLIFFASFVNRNAYWKIKPFDLFCGALSVAGLACWAFTQDGNIAIAAAIAADGLAAIPTVVKCYRNPETESPWLFWFAAFNSIITLATIDHWRFATYGFAAYLALICLTMGSLVSFKVGPRWARA